MSLPYTSMDAPVVIWEMVSYPGVEASMTICRCWIQLPSLSSMKENVFASLRVRIQPATEMPSLGEMLFRTCLMRVRMGMGLVDERGDDNVEDEFEWAVMKA